MSKLDALHDRLAAVWRHRGGGVTVRRAGRGYSLFSERTGAPMARRRPTAAEDRVQVLWWNGERWAASGPFGIATMSPPCRLTRRSPTSPTNRPSGSMPDPKWPKSS